MNPFDALAATGVRLGKLLHTQKKCFGLWKNCTVGRIATRTVKRTKRILVPPSRSLVVSQILKQQSALSQHKRLYCENFRMGLIDC